METNEINFHIVTLPLTTHSLAPPWIPCTRVPPVVQGHLPYLEYQLSPWVQDHLWLLWNQEHQRNRMYRLLPMEYGIASVLLEYIYGRVYY